MRKIGAAVLHSVGQGLGAHCGCCGERALTDRGAGVHDWQDSLCVPCRLDWPPPWSQGGPEPTEQAGTTFLGLWPYQGSLRRLLVQAKEEVRGAPSALLQRAILEELLRRLSRYPWPGRVWIPVPPSRRRRWRGAYLPEELGPVAARQIGGKWCRRLSRVKQVPAQTGLSGEQRRRNLGGAFAYRRQAPQALTLFDDVRTTGASLEEATRAVREAGAILVRQVVVAVVP